MNKINKNIVYPKVVIYNRLLQDTDKILNMLKKAESSTEQNYYMHPWKEWKPMGLINNINIDESLYDENASDEKKDQEDCFKNIYKTFHLAANDFFEMYENENDWPTFIKTWDKSQFPWSYSGISFLKYNPTNYNFDIRTKKFGLAMDYHTDTHEFNTDSPGEKFIVTVTMYLNDDYDGGEISYLDERTGKVINYKPKAGDVTVFPSGSPYYHGILPVFNKERYLLRMFWFYHFNGTDEWIENEKKYGVEKWKEMEDERIKKEFDSGRYHRVVVYPGEKYSPDTQKSKPFYAKEKPIIITGDDNL